ncbi:MULTISPECIES: hypothetical protein [Halobacteriovorax]|uniref:Uncharacterized protein n=1 Tax=Halobacteriovorax vibrionivorans TaxID=2152716 RepID=A0ABY0IBX9_9BACT|nr:MULTISPECIES: hypothetical protein [Halobacteriovorax]RZF20474.1 hypothetical protein DAY19_10825 [Halobacteriovorax vibrionivorans]TGD48833.1 hypothetical protein EP118_02230 [Halobacteriovorax sp. Y22]
MKNQLVNSKTAEISGSNTNQNQLQLFNSLYIDFTETKKILASIREKIIKTDLIIFRLPVASIGPLKRNI